VGRDRAIAQIAAREHALRARTMYLRLAHFESGSDTPRLSGGNPQAGFS
jgi:hypothetical protein